MKTKKQYNELIILTWQNFIKQKIAEIVITGFCVLLFFGMPLLVFSLYWHNTPNSFLFHEFCEEYQYPTAFSECHVEYYPSYKQIGTLVKWGVGAILSMAGALVVWILILWLSYNWDKAKRKAKMKLLRDKKIKTK